MWLHRSMTTMPVGVTMPMVMVVVMATARA
jgi:hypothetical protein